MLTAFGYTAGGLNPGGVSGFLNSSWTLNTSGAIPRAEQTWKRLPDAPVSGRQEVAAAKIGDALFFIGGFAYSPPFSYNDTLKLEKIAGVWTWSKLADFPYALSSMGVVSIGQVLYVVGGADYNRTGFCVQASCTGRTPLGSGIHSLDTSQTKARWQRLPDLPGVPRWVDLHKDPCCVFLKHPLLLIPQVNQVHSVTAVRGEIYVIGGALSGPSDWGTTSFTIVDNWKYTPATKHWTRLADSPMASGNFQTGGDEHGAFLDRYIILIGGYEYSYIAQMNKTISPTAGYKSAMQMCDPSKPPPLKDQSRCHESCAASKEQQGSEYYNDVFVYDTQKDEFGVAAASSSEEPCLMPKGCGGYPMNDNLPQTNLRGDKLFTIGGECDGRKVCGLETYTHYPRLALVGTLKAVEN